MTLKVESPIHKTDSIASSKFKVDEEQINNCVETLKKLVEECQEIKAKKIPKSEDDKGQTHNELYTLCNKLKTTSHNLGELIDRTLQFLGQASELHKESDKTSASVLAGVSAAAGTAVANIGKSSSTSSSST